MRHFSTHGSVTTLPRNSNGAMCVCVSRRGKRYAIRRRKAALPHLVKNSRGMYRGGLLRQTTQLVSEIAMFIKRPMVVWRSLVFANFLDVRAASQSVITDSFLMVTCT